MSFKEKYVITPRYLTAPSKRRCGFAMSAGVKFIVAHDTGNPGSTAASNVKYYENSRNAMSASAHLFVDDKEIIECIPALTNSRPEKAWHVLYNVPTDDQLYGCNANDCAIGVEYCYGGNINADEAYRKYIWVMAKICSVFGINPATGIIGHCILDPKRKTDPVTGLLQSRRTYEQLLRDVVIEYNDCTGVASAPITGFTDLLGEAIATHKLNVRKGAPNTLADVVQVVQVGTALKYNGYTTQGQSINGNTKWFRNPNGDFFWSGAVRL